MQNMWRIHQHEIYLNSYSPVVGLPLILVPGSSRIKDALGDMIPPAPPVLRSLYNLVPADVHFPEIFLDTSFQFCRSRPGLLLKPSGSHVRACRGSLWSSIRERCPSHSDVCIWYCFPALEVQLPLWLSHLLLCLFRKSPGYFVAICGVLLLVFFHLCDWDWPQLCTVEQRGED